MTYSNNYARKCGRSLRRYPCWWESQKGWPVLWSYSSTIRRAHIFILMAAVLMMFLPSTDSEATKCRCSQAVWQYCTWCWLWAAEQRTTCSICHKIVANLGFIICWCSCLLVTISIKSYFWCIGCAILWIFSALSLQVWNISSNCRCWTHTATATQGWSWWLRNGTSSDAHACWCRSSSTGRTRATLAALPTPCSHSLSSC